MDRNGYSDWSKRWRKACTAAKASPRPRTYDLRHTFASLLLAEGRTVHYVAAQLGHDPALTLSTYGHVIAEFEHEVNIDAEEKIRAARTNSGTPQVPKAIGAATGS